MTETKQPLCPICNHAQGWIEKLPADPLTQDMISIPCICRRMRDTETFLGAEIWGAAGIKSHLYGGEDFTLKNLFIRGPDALALSHLRTVLAAKKQDMPFFRFRRTTDNQLLKVWGGDYGYNRRPKES